MLQNSKPEGFGKQKGNRIRKRIKEAKADMKPSKILRGKNNNMYSQPAKSIHFWHACASSPRLTYSLLIVSAVLFGTLLFQNLSSENAGPRLVSAQNNPVSIAVVDLERVFDSSNDKTLMEKQIEADYQVKIGELEQLKKDISNLQKELNIKVEGSDAFNEIQDNLAVKSTMIKLKQERFKREIDQRQAQAFNAVYESIHACARKVATEQGIDILLQRRLRVSQEAPPWESVFFARPEVDITELVIKTLNGK